MKNCFQPNENQKLKALQCRWCVVFVMCLMLCCLGSATYFATQFAPQLAYAHSFEEEVNCVVQENLDNLAGKSAYLMDVASGSVIYARNEKDRLPIASMTKIMTALLVLEAVERGDLSFDEEISVSEESASMGGSQVFLDAGSTHRVDELLKTVIVASANDSCVALAERISGSVGAFVGDMNARAKELGMTDTNFKNCTGLPAAESFSSAKDVALMFNELIKFPKFFEYSTLWLEDYQHPSGRTTTITNTNKLVRFYKGCDGGKTGFTSESKFCLAATAERNNMRVIAVVVGADSSKSRFAAVSGMFNHAFDEYEHKILLNADEAIENNIEVTYGKKKCVKIGAEENVTQFAKRGDKGEFEVKLELPNKISAPLRRGDVVGKAMLLHDGVVVAEKNIIALEDIARMNLFDAIKNIGRLWNKGI